MLETERGAGLTDEYEGDRSLEDKLTFGATLADESLGERASDTLNHHTKNPDLSFPILDSQETLGSTLAKETLEEASHTDKEFWEAKALNPTVANANVSYTSESGLKNFGK